MGYQVKYKITKTCFNFKKGHFPLYVVVHIMRTKKIKGFKIILITVYKSNFVILSHRVKYFLTKELDL